MANPRKFSEKIALHNQKQAEETAEFERIMQEVSVTRDLPPRGVQPPRPVTHLQPYPQAYMRQYLGGSLPNVNIELHQPAGPDDGKHAMRHPSRFDTRMRPYGYIHKKGGIPLELANRHRMGYMDSQPGPYAGPFLSPPSESNWRRTNSDSALHQSVMNPNPQDPFNPNHPMMNQGRRDFNENHFNNMPPSYKAIMDNKKFQQHLQLGNKPKSCETTPNISLHPSSDSHPALRPGEDTASMQHLDNGPGPGPISHGLPHVVQIGNNTASLPDLTNFHNPSPLSNPIDFDDIQGHHPSSQQAPIGQNPPLYNQARSTTNLPTAPAISPHISGLSCGSASSNRSRRHTHNGPSPLSISSPEHARRMKYPNVTSPKVQVKSELKSPPIGRTYPYAYPQPGTQAQAAGRGIHPQQLGQSGTQLRIDVTAASKEGQQQSAYIRGLHGASVTSPLTSPTSPTTTTLNNQVSFSPVTSPRHELTTGTNPTLSEAYHRAEMAVLHPLQQQFEQFHVMDENSSSQQHSRAPPMYCALAAPSENSTEAGYDLHGNSGSLIHGLHGVHGRHSTNPGKIPHIVFTGVDDNHVLKESCLGTNDFNSAMSHGVDSEYFTSDDLKANLGIEGLQMLDEPNIVTDSAIEDSLQLDTM